MLHKLQHDQAPLVTFESHFQDLRILDDANVSPHLNPRPYHLLNNFSLGSRRGYKATSPDFQHGLESNPVRPKMVGAERSVLMVQEIGTGLFPNHRRGDNNCNSFRSRGKSCGSKYERPADET